MKDYSMSEEDQKDFILNFDIEEDKIIVKFGDGRTKILPYSLELKHHILDKMESQIDNAKDKDLTQKSSRVFIKETLITMGCFLINYLLFLIPTTNIFIILVKDLIGISIYTIPLVRLTKIIKRPFYNEDFEINKFIKENKDALNEEIKKDPTLQNTITKSLSRKLNSAKKDEVFDVNFADKLSLRDLKILKNYIESYKNNNTTEEKEFTLSRK